MRIVGSLFLSLKEFFLCRWEGLVLCRRCNGESYNTIQGYPESSDYWKGEKPQNVWMGRHKSQVDPRRFLRDRSEFACFDSIRL